MQLNIVSTFTELCNQHHYPLLEHFYHPKRPQILSFQLQPQATTNILPDSRDLPLLDVFYKCDHALDGLLPGFFHLVLGAHHAVAGIMSSFFYCWIVFHHVGNIFYSFTRWGILLLFPLFGLTSPVVVNVCPQDSTWTYIFICLGEIPTSGFFVGFGTYCETGLPTCTGLCSHLTRIRLLPILLIKSDVSEKVKYVLVS